MRKDLLFSTFVTAFLSFTAWLFWTPLSPVSLTLITGCSVLVSALSFFCLSWVRSERSPFPVMSVEIAFVVSALLMFVAFVLSFYFPVGQVGTALMVRYASSSFIIAVVTAMISTENAGRKYDAPAFEAVRTKPPVY